MSARILVIDDEANIRETMRMALEVEGYVVGTADDGQEGLLSFGTGAGWDLLLLDQRMPGMDGLEVLRQVRERDPAARVVMVTAYGTIELAVDAMKAGAVDFLRKPFTPEVLRGAVKAALAHPRKTHAEEAYSLTRLLPAGAPAQAGTGLPFIHFRTLNGYKLWPVPLPADEEETDSLRVRRAFEVRSPSGETHPVAVDVTMSVRTQVREITGRDFEPQDPIWDTVCRTALCHHLWEQANLPPDNLPVYSLTRDQAQTVRAMAGLAPSRVE